MQELLAVENIFNLGAIEVANFIEYFSTMFSVRIHESISDRKKTMNVYNT